MMLSPIPGMDPYLENPDIWSDFHTTLYVAVRSSLNHVLPPGFVARIDRYVWIHEPEAEERILLGKPDAFGAQTQAAPTPMGPTATLTPPSTVVLPAIRHQGNRYVKILDVARRRVVTVFEILSPSNKVPGKDRDAYLMKRSEYLGAGVNLLELDLLRTGQRMPWGNQTVPPAPYYLLISRARDFPHAGLWPISLREKLPTIPVPLLDNLPEPTLDLQSSFTTAFEQGMYAQEIDYTKPAAPPLEPDDALWFTQLVKQKK